MFGGRGGRARSSRKRLEIEAKLRCFRMGVMVVVVVKKRWIVSFEDPGKKIAG
jgi:hypothetical protein